MTRSHLSTDNYYKYSCSKSYIIFFIQNQSLKTKETCYKNISIENKFNPFKNINVS